MQDLFFLRDVATRQRFIHPTGDHVFQSVYGLRPGHVGACCFTSQQVAKFFALWDGEEIERVSVQKLLL
jgi:hypothetical protein